MITIMKAAHLDKAASIRFARWKRGIMTKNAHGQAAREASLAFRCLPDLSMAHMCPICHIALAVLFSEFAVKVAKIRGEEEKDKSDLFSRMTSRRGRSGDISAGLRHNINLLLAQVRR